MISRISPILARMDWDAVFGKRNADPQEGKIAEVELAL